MTEGGPESSGKMKSFEELTKIREKFSDGKIPPEEVTSKETAPHNLNLKRKSIYSESELLDKTYTEPKDKFSKLDSIFETNNPTKFSRLAKGFLSSEVFLACTSYRRCKHQDHEGRK